MLYFRLKKRTCKNEKRLKNVQIESQLCIFFRLIITIVNSLYVQKNYNRFKRFMMYKYK